MKFHFEDNLDYQLTAINSVVDLFKGQELSRTEFTVVNNISTNTAQGSLELGGNEKGVGNRLQLVDDEILDNLRNVQLRSGLRPDTKLNSGDFTVEMETGTGKTYVYLRTLFELHKNYGFTKFIIVVPSVAIKEGVNKTLEITQEHFEALYPLAKGYEYFLYDSSFPNQVRDFATSHNIQIMVMTVGSINKRTVNNIYKEHENIGGEKPIELIRATKPVVIVDEPQSVDGGLKGSGKKALDEMNPLCTIRYSATHADKYHMVYRLDAVDAYQRGLVKQIEVASLEIEGNFNRPYVKLISVHNHKSSITAKVQLHKQKGGKVSPTTVTVEDGDNLEDITNRNIYANMQVGTITTKKGEESIQIRGANLDELIQEGQELGGIDNDARQRLMIRRTIKEHLDKEVAFATNQKPIKVLSLFFIETVSDYRQYNDDGNPSKGKVALMFEEEYKKLSRSPEYQQLFHQIDVETDVSEIHNGYFSIDKKVVSPFEVVNLKKSSTKEDVETSTYNLIMKDKERLLSFDTKLKFIFSHSTLREGWDNPNVFQICTLRDMSTERQRRQTIGRGLRLCVNQQGNRLRGSDINTLTVIATESYEEFAEKLQKEIETDTGIRFGVVEKHQFANIPVEDSEGNVIPLGVENSEKLWKHFQQVEFIDKKGNVTDVLREALKSDTFEVPEEFKEQKEHIETILRKLSGKLDIKDADNRRVITTNEAILDSEEFKDLWDRIKYQTTYRVNFDNEALIENCAKFIENDDPITKARARFRNADLAIGEGGVEATESKVSAFSSITEQHELPDILTIVQDETQLTRASIAKILIKSQRLDDLKRNPQQFIAQVIKAINQIKQLALVDGIKYQKLGDNYYYAQELFKQEELRGYLENTIDATKSVYHKVIYDSAGIERSFAQDLETNESVKLYVKLPAWFTVPTPLGTYNPDWAVLIEDSSSGIEKLYFVVETKSSTFFGDLRHKEGAKINCGKKHFEEIAVFENSAKYVHATTVDGVLDYTESS